jgi:purine nucleoside phosphorylase
MLAIEAGMHYCGASVVTNYGAGLTDAAIAHESVHGIVVGVAPKLQAILVDAVDGLELATLPPRGTAKFSP